MNIVPSVQNREPGDRLKTHKSHVLCPSSVFPCLQTITSYQSKRLLSHGKSVVVTAYNTCITE